MATKMSKGLKWALIIGGVGVSGVALYFLWKKVIKPKIDKGSTGDSENKESYQNDEQVKSNDYNRVSRESYPETPFTSKVEGDKFRNWINDTYPKYAVQIDLDRSGDYNNSYIRKAYAQYGAEYQKVVKESDISSRAQNPLSSEFKNLLSSWKKPVYYNKGGVAYFMLKFRKEQDAWGGDGECNGIVYIFNTTENYLQGKTNDKRGVIGVYWNGKQLGSGYWENGLKKIVGTTGCLKGVTISNPPSLGKAIGNNCNMPKFVWC